MYIYGGMNHEDQLLGDLSAFKFNGTCRLAGFRI
jgi:hypothetical protein